MGEDLFCADHGERSALIQGVKEDYVVLDAKKGRERAQRTNKRGKQDFL